MSTRSFKRAHARRVARDRRRSTLVARKGSQVAGLALTAGTLFVANASAATYTVMGTSDGVAGPCSPAGPGAFNCTTLRDAVGAAVGDTTPDTINFAGSATGMIRLTNGPLTLNGSDNVAINGPGAATLTVSGDANNNGHADSGDSQIFVITSPVAFSDSISNLTLTDGYSGTSKSGAAIDDTGEAALTLTGDTITNSISGDTGKDGGAIYTEGSITITGSTISGNTSADFGGGLFVRSSAGPNPAHLTVTNSTISGNTADAGGGIAGGKYVTITDSHITGNNAVGNSSGYGYGGGILQYEGSLSLSGSTISGNTALTGGGGIAVVAGKYGTTVQNSTISGNTADEGGGIALLGLNHFTGTGDPKYNPVLIQNTTISGNHGTDGAGMSIRGIGSGNPVKILQSTISGNVGSPSPSSFGGGLLVTGWPKYDHSTHHTYLYPVSSPVDVADSTIAGNTATNGAGVSLGLPAVQVVGTSKDSSGSLTFDNSTIAGNTAAASGGGIFLSGYGAANGQSTTATLNSTIVAGNTAAGAGQDLARVAGSTSGGFNGAFSLIQAPAGAPMLSQKAMIIGQNPLLGPLANNGGVTDTMLPSGTSPVIDQGRAPDWLTTDQRGNPRTVDTLVPNPVGGDGTDIGAVELPASGVATAGFTASVRHTKLGSGSPLLVGGTTPVSCAVTVGTLASCKIEVLGAHNTVLATGEVTTSGSPKSLTTEVSPTTAGQSLLGHDPLGVSASASVAGGTSQSGSQTVSGKVTLLGPSITLRLSDSAKLSGKLKKQLKSVAKLLSGAKSVTCTAYSDVGKNGSKADVQLTKAEAKAACTAIHKDGFKGKVKSVGKGDASPAAKQLVITFKF